MGREIIFIHLGQAGVQMGSAFWELFCIEHGVCADGMLDPMVSMVDDFGIHEDISAFFHEGKCSLTPRAVMVDLEPSVIDEVRMGPYRDLWRPACMLTGKEDAASNYGRGHYTVGKEQLTDVVEAVRKVVEASSNVASFEMVHSYSGGTGSGFTSLVTDYLSEEFGKKFRFSASVFPSSTYSQSTVDPYNAVLHSHSTMETLDCDIIFDNQTMFELCTKNLNIQQPTYTQINRMLAQMISSVFMSHRFIYHGSQHADTTELLTNLIPYPRIHFPCMSYCPLIGRNQFHHEMNTIHELTRGVFSRSSQTLDFSNEENMYISCAMLYRGSNSPREIFDALLHVKNTKSGGPRFVEWCPTGFKIGLNTMPPATFPNSPIAESIRSVCMVAGNLGVRDTWQRNNSKFDVLLSRRSFVHWFVGEGVEEGEFIEAREDLAYLEQDYAELMIESGNTNIETPVIKIHDDRLKSEKNKESPVNMPLENVVPEAIDIDLNNANIYHMEPAGEGTNNVFKSPQFDALEFRKTMQQAYHVDKRRSHDKCSKLKNRQSMHHAHSALNAQGAWNEIVPENDSTLFKTSPGKRSHTKFGQLRKLNRIECVESGERNTPLDHSVVHLESNMNNPRRSCSSVGTDFVPTEPMIQISADCSTNEAYSSLSRSPLISSIEWNDENVKRSDCEKPKGSNPDGKFTSTWSDSVEEEQRFVAPTHWHSSPSRSATITSGNHNETTSYTRSEVGLMCTTEAVDRITGSSSSGVRTMSESVTPNVTSSSSVLLVTTASEGKEVKQSGSQVLHSNQHHKHRRKCRRYHKHNGEQQHNHHTSKTTLTVISSAVTQINSSDEVVETSIGDRGLISSSNTGSQDPSCNTNHATHEVSVSY